MAVDESRHQGASTEVDLFRAVGRDRASIESGYVVPSALQFEEFKILNRIGVSAICLPTRVAVRAAGQISNPLSGFCRFAIAASSARFPLLFAGLSGFRCFDGLALVGRQFAEVVVLNVDWPFDKPLDSTQMRALGGVAERIGHAFRAGSGRPSNPVDIAFRFVRQLEIDDMGDAVDVDAARGDVGRDKNPQPVGFKSVQGPLTGCLRFVAVNGRGLDTGLAQLLC